jgi:hypothetical protein
MVLREGYFIVPAPAAESEVSAAMYWPLSTLARGRRWSDCGAKNSFAAMKLMPSEHALNYGPKVNRCDANTGLATPAVHWASSILGVFLFKAHGGLSAFCDRRLGRCNHLPSSPGFRTEVLGGAKEVGVSVPFRAHETHSRHEPGRAPVRSRERFPRRGSAPLRGASTGFGHRRWRIVLTRRD